MLEVLRTIYRLQKQHFYPYEIMPRLIEALHIGEEEAVLLVKELIDLGWLSTRGFLPSYFLRPGYICRFPVIISACGLALLKKESAP
ncbi:hypothetical protein [Desulfovirgula thermocuniculi]|uniref:hypothetical protein n=1 Tax=Desulfovirgula thermocuniculi TaxID=348842 RepID=UPI00146FBB9B|nr:hypothetical protein [Desulfovirgula thermocuniculi]